MGGAGRATTGTRLELRPATLGRAVGIRPRNDRRWAAWPSRAASHWELVSHCNPILGASRVGRSVKAFRLTVAQRPTVILRIPAPGSPRFAPSICIKRTKGLRLWPVSGDDGGSQVACRKAPRRRDRHRRIAQPGRSNKGTRFTHHLPKPLGSTRPPAHNGAVSSPTPRRKSLAAVGSSTSSPPHNATSRRRCSDAALRP